MENIISIKLRNVDNEKLAGKKVGEAMPKKVGDEKVFIRIERKRGSENYFNEKN